MPNFHAGNSNRVTTFRWNFFIIRCHLFQQYVMDAISVPDSVPVPCPTARIRWRLFIHSARHVFILLNKDLRLTRTFNNLRAVRESFVPFHSARHHLFQSKQGLRVTPTSNNLRALRVTVHLEHARTFWPVRASADRAASSCQRSPADHRSPGQVCCHRYNVRVNRNVLKIE
jgi:hypothetical protein